MKEKNPAYKYIQWQSHEELHEACLSWKSELEFIQDEQQFLNELIKDHTLQLLAGPVYKECLKLVGELSEEEKKIVVLLEKLQRHANKVEILIYGMDTPEDEKTYKEDHYLFSIEISRFNKGYRKTKTGIFNLIKRIMKQEKQKRISS